MEKLIPVTTYEAVYICDECGEGELKRLPRVLLLSPPKFPHECPACGAKKTFKGKRYPCMAYKRAEQAGKGES